MATENWQRWCGCDIFGDNNTIACPSTC